MRVLKVLLVAILVALGVAPSARADGGHGGGPLVSVVAAGLDSPRHLAFGSRGDLFVAEAGRGGRAPCFIGGEGPACLGATRRGHEGRSLGPPVADRRRPGFDREHAGQRQRDRPARHPRARHGPRLSHQRRPDRAQGRRPARRSPRDTLAAQNPVADLFGRVLLINRHGTLRQLADIWEFERDVNPDATVGNPAVDSNPVDLLRRRRALRRRRRGRQRDRHGRRLRPRQQPRGVPEPPVPNPFGGPHDPDAGGADLGRRGAGSPVLRQPAHRLPVPDRRRQRLPRGPAHRRRERRSRAASPTSWTSPSGATAPCTCSRSTTTACSARQPTTARCSRSSRDGAKRQIDLPAGALPFPGGIAVGDDGLYVTINARSPAAARSCASACAENICGGAG